MSTGECDDLKSLGAEVPDYYKSGASALFLSFAGFPPLVDFCIKFLVLQECIEIEIWAAICAVLVRSFINLLVWIWILSFSITGV
jgi:NADH:ubiquinone oxidoreductase subunit 2 (subunit N)